MHWGSPVEDPARLQQPGQVEILNSQQISCLDSSLGRVPACDAGDRGSIPGGGKLKVCLQGALLEDRDDPVYKAASISSAPLHPCIFFRFITSYSNPVRQSLYLSRHQ
jgi:hypothetical protein